MLKKFRDCNRYRQDIKLTLDVVSDWTTNPRIKRELQNLQQEIELLEEHLQTQKAQQSAPRSNKGNLYTS